MPTVHALNLGKQPVAAGCGSHAIHDSSALVPAVVPQPLPPGVRHRHTHNVRETTEKLRQVEENFRESLNWPETGSGFS